MTKTYLYLILTPLSSFLYSKIGFTGVNIIFLISAQNIDCLGGAVQSSNHNLFFVQKYEKYQNLSENFQFLVVFKIHVYRKGRVFVMHCKNFDRVDII